MEWGIREWGLAWGVAVILIGNLVAMVWATATHVQSDKSSKENFAKFSVEVKDSINGAIKERSDGDRKLHERIESEQKKTDGRWKALVSLVRTIVLKALPKDTGVNKEAEALSKMNGG